MSQRKYPVIPHSSTSNLVTNACPNPQGACVELSFARSIRSAKSGLSVRNPRRDPGQMVSGKKVSSVQAGKRRNELEKVSIRITRPW